MCFRICRAPELFNPKSSCGMWQKHCVTSKMEEEVSRFRGKLNDDDDDDDGDDNRTLFSPKLTYL